MSVILVAVIGMMITCRVSMVAFDAFLLTVHTARDVTPLSILLTRISLHLAMLCSVWWLLFAFSTLLFEMRASALSWCTSCLMQLRWRAACIARLQPTVHVVAESMLLRTRVAFSDVETIDIDENRCYHVRLFNFIARIMSL